MKNRIEIKPINGEELVEVLILALIENDKINIDKVEKVRTELKEYIFNGKKEFSFWFENGFSSLAYLGDRDNTENDSNYIYYEYLVELNGRRFTFNSSSYIKDQCICDEVYVYESLVEEIEVEISEREYLLNENEK